VPPEILKRKLTDRERHQLRVLERQRLATDKMIGVAERRQTGLDRVLDKVCGRNASTPLERLHDRRDALERQAEQIRSGDGVTP
jgi:hypothetical protein